MPPILAGRGLWWRMALAAGAGAIAAFGLSPWGLWPLTLLSLAFLPGLLLSAATWRQAAMSGWAFGTGYFAHALVWIVEPFMIEPDRYAWMAPFALVFLAGGLALFWGAAFAVAWRLGRTPGRQTALLGVALAIAEVARGYVLTGFPWAGFAQIWIDSAVAPLLAWIGPQGLGALTLAVALPLGHAAYRSARAGGLALSTIPALALAAATGLAYRTMPEVTTTGAVVRLVQPNAPQQQKWDPAWISVFFQRQLDFTAAAPRPDLVVWPESALPVLLEEAGPALEAVAQAAAGAQVALGAQRFIGSRVYNSLAVVDASGDVADVYDKHHLVPFGEYIPFGDFAARAGVRGFAAQQGDGYSPGPGPQLVSLGPLGMALPLICYEAVFPQDVGGAPERPALLLQVTNDAWFGTTIGPYQHLAQARMRAIEQGLPLARSANTGVSAMINPLGRVTQSLPLGQAGFVDAPLPAPLPPTLYSRAGDLPVLLLLLFAGFVAWRAPDVTRRSK